MDSDPDEPGSFASPPCSLHELGPEYLGEPATGTAPKTTTAPRSLPERAFPPYAYLPGRSPHPVRDPEGHSYKPPSPTKEHGADADPDAFRWGVDLFNHGFYWEAHEAWEGLWRDSAAGSSERSFLHGLILLAAAGVKLREGKWAAARRHGMRAASYLRASAAPPNDGPASALCCSPTMLAKKTEDAVLAPTASTERTAFDFVLG